MSEKKAKQERDPEAAEQPKAEEAPKQKTCFVVTPIGKDGSDHRRHADLMFKYVICEVLAEEPFNYRCERADKIGEAGSINDQIVSRLLDADLVVADLSFHNPNAFYELAIRHMVRKPFIHVINSTTDFPFDVAGDRAIRIDLGDLESVYAAKKELADQAQYFLDGGEVQSTFTRSIDINEIRRAAPDGDVLADILSELRSLRNDRSAWPKAQRPDLARLYSFTPSEPTIEIEDFSPTSKPVRDVVTLRDGVKTASFPTGMLLQVAQREWLLAIGGLKNGFPNELRGNETIFTIGEETFRAAVRGHSSNGRQVIFNLASAPEPYTGY